MPSESMRVDVERKGEQQAREGSCERAARDSQLHPAERIKHRAPLASLNLIASPFDLPHPQDHSKGRQKANVMPASSRSRSPEPRSKRKR